MKGWRLLHRGSDAFWIGAVPTGWPRMEWWTDLATGWVIDQARGGQIETRKLPDEVLYLPPVPADAGALRRERLIGWMQAGARTVLHVVAGGAEPNSVQPSPTLTVWDPTALLIVGDVEQLSTPPAGSWVLWPVIPGVSDDPRRFEGFARRAADAGVEGVLPMTPQLSPRSRRVIVDHHGGGIFESLHHRTSVEPSEIARVAWEFGLPFQPPRPGRSGESEVHVRACSELGHLGDLYIRLGQDERGQRVLRAQRWLEDSPWDLEVILRDGHLKLVPELADEAAVVVEEVLDTGTSVRLGRVREMYLSGAVSGQAE